MRPQVMGIVNVTPQSAFGGHSTDPAHAIGLGRRLVQEGADLLDVSGAPKGGGVDSATEAARVLPVVEALADEIPICVGTTSSEVAEAAIGAGASLLSDQSGELYQLAARKGAGWIVLHRPGSSAAGLGNREASDQTVAYLTAAARRALQAGVARVWIDPGLGFDRPPAQSLALLANIGELVETGYPVLVSASRKRFLDFDSTAALAAATWGLDSGAAMVRVHDVEATVQAIDVVVGRPRAAVAS